MAGVKKRVRATNFSAEDCHKLVDIVIKFSGTIEDKRTDAVIWREKDTAWKSVCTEYNACTLQNRSADQLRMKYEKLKGTTRQTLAKERQCRLQTGGGPFLTTPSPQTIDLGLIEKIRSLIPLSAEGMTTTVDSDGIQPSSSDIQNGSILQVELYDYEGGEGTDSENDILNSILDEGTPRPRTDLLDDIQQAGCSKQSQVKKLKPDTAQSRSFSNLEAEGNGLGDGEVEAVTDWKVYSPAMLRRPKHSSLQAKHKQTTEPDASDSWIGRRRPTVPFKQTFAMSASTEKFSKLAEAKGALATCQQDLLKQEYEAENKRKDIIHSIDVKIKEAILVNLKLDEEIKRTTLESLQLELRKRKDVQ